MNIMLPKKMFFTKGVGYHKDELQSFEHALRNAGIEKYNLVSISSILPPECRIVPTSEGLKALTTGQITFLVMSRLNTNEPNRLVTAAIGLAQPHDKKQYGYISEHHAYGETMKKAKDFSEDLAATMLASTLGIELDPDTAWDERKKLYITDKDRKFATRSIAKSAEGHKDGLWTTVVACAVMLLD
jgi:arginine decarboxylase